MGVWFSFSAGHLVDSSHCNPGQCEQDSKERRDNSGKLGLGNRSKETGAPLWCQARQSEIKNTPSNAQKCQVQDLSENQGKSSQGQGCEAPPEYSAAAPGSSEGHKGGTGEVGSTSKGQTRPDSGTRVTTHLLADMHYLQQAAPVCGVVLLVVNLQGVAYHALQLQAFQDGVLLAVQDVTGVRAGCGVHVQGHCPSGQQEQQDA